MHQSFPELQVIVIAPTQTMFKGQATSISSQNQQGPFDILPQHTHYVSLIQNQIIIKHQDQSTELKIHKGILHCLNDQVEIYITQL